MNTVIIFFVSGFCSFMGSAPPGILNMYVFQLGLQKREMAARQFILAVGVAEFFFAWIALHCSRWIAATPWVVAYFHYAAICVLAVMGMLMLRKAGRPQEVKKNKIGFGKGLLLSVLNPLVIPFWIGISTYMQLHGWLRENTVDMLAFATGAAGGVASLLLVYLHLSTKLAGEHWYDRIKYLPGVSLLGLAAYTCVKLL